jgi:hypothetical protein
MINDHKLSINTKLALFRVPACRRTVPLREEVRDLLDSISIVFKSFTEFVFDAS